MGRWDFVKQCFRRVMWSALVPCGRCDGVRRCWRSTSYGNRSHSLPTLFACLSLKGGRLRRVRRTPCFYSFVPLLVLCIISHERGETPINTGSPLVSVLGKFQGRGTTKTGLGYEGYEGRRSFRADACAMLALAKQGEGEMEEGQAGSPILSTAKNGPGPRSANLCSVCHFDRLRLCLILAST
jgi:hypothetical protein